MVKIMKMKLNDDQANRSRSWSVTWNNPTNPLNSDAIQYGDFLVYQLEQGEEKTPHYQGYVHWKNAKSRSATMKALGIPKGAEVQPAINDERLIDYSQKPTGWWYKGQVFDNKPHADAHWSEQLEGPWEYGNRPKGQGTRSDMDEIKKLLDQGVCLDDIEGKYFKTFARYRKYFQDYRNRNTEHRNRQPEIKLLIGKSGIGKSRWANDKYPKAYHLHCSNGGSNLWFDGYDLESTIIIDEFYGQTDIDMMLKLLNSYQQFTGQIKGGHIKIVAHRFIITSNLPPSKWYDEKKVKPDVLNAFYRRIWEFGEFVDPVDNKNYTLTQPTQSKVCNFMVIENRRTGEILDHAKEWDADFRLKLHRGEVSNTENLTSSQKENNKKTKKKKKNLKIVKSIENGVN